jgi:hypothetical protein
VNERDPGFVREIEEVFQLKRADWVTGDGQRVMLTRDECYDLIMGHLANRLRKVPKTPEEIEKYLQGESL